MKQRSTLDTLQWDGFGFPVVLKGPLWLTTDKGYKVLNVDFSAVERNLLPALLLKSSPLTVGEIEFMRQMLEMSPAEFSGYVGFSVREAAAKEQDEQILSFQSEMMVRIKVAMALANELVGRILDEFVKPGKLVLEEKPVPAHIEVS